MPSQDVMETVIGILEENASEEILADPTYLYTKALVSARGDADGYKKIVEEEVAILKSNEYPVLKAPKGVSAVTTILAFLRDYVGVTPPMEIVKAMVILGNLVYLRGVDAGKASVTDLM